MFISTKTKMKMNYQSTTSKFLWSSSLNYLLMHLMILLSNLAASSAARSSGNETDLLALLSIKNQISDAGGILNSWNGSKHHCQWLGVTCNRRHGRVTRLNLDGLSLSGLISPHMGNLSFLNFINLSNNTFSGEIPQEIGRLRRLRYIYLRNNALGGQIPVTISNCVRLRVVDLLQNMLVGSIPLELGNLSNLEMLSLGNNNLTGEIPSSVGNLTTLTRMNVHFNNLEGKLPEELGRLTSLAIIIVGPNSFVPGVIPQALYNISSLTQIAAPLSSLQGRIPASIGLTLPNLRRFQVGGNQLGGTIPDSLANASMVEDLDLGTNLFQGQVPTSLGKLKNLVWLNVQWNYLGSNSTGDLDFIESLSNCSNLRSLILSNNSFGGELPYSIGNLSGQLEQLDLGVNQISGEVPASLENLDKLYLLGLDNNLFSGAIPGFLGKFQMLQTLFLRNNSFSGQIPPSLFNNTSLFGLHLEYNRLEGGIPAAIGNCQSLQLVAISQNNLNGSIPTEIFKLTSLTALTLSDNSLSGSLAPEIGNLDNLYVLEISDNRLSGEIPTAIGNCLKLQYISMRGNLFQGIIPKDIALIKGVLLLDLSRNNITGRIPKELEELPLLQLMNLSFNNLEGEVPTGGFWSNTSAISLVGNENLCGGIPQLQFPSCPVASQKRKKSLVIWITVPSAALGFILVALLASYIFYFRRTRKSSDFTAIECLSRISYHELQKATDGFSASNLIGSGSFGTVYKGTLQDGTHEKAVAVKVLDLKKNGASKSFLSECTALKNIRHRNLVRVLTCCSSNDFQRREFKAIVYEYMPNGDLDVWMHKNSDETNGSDRNLTMIQRLNIAIDVALALDYLHNNSQIPIVHCDLKPSNILIDDEFTAHVGDFGLARLLYDNTSNPSQPLSASIGIKGSLGYAAPEYGMGGEASTLGDVYSFGIFLLEMFTGRRPTDEYFRDGLNLHDHVKEALPRHLLEIVDPRLLAEIRTEDEEIQVADVMEKCLVSLFNVGLCCSSETPRDRKDMKDVVSELMVTKRDVPSGSGTQR